MFDFSLTDEQLQIKKEVARFAENELREQCQQAEAEGVPKKLRRGLHRLGLSILEIPEEYDGVGLDNLTRVVVAEELAFGDLGIDLATEGAGGAGLALLELGREEQKKQWLPAFASEADASAGLALWEDDRASQLGVVATTWRETSSGYRLSGRKRFVLHAGDPGARFFVVSARLEGLPASTEMLPPPDLRLFVVPADAAGLAVEPGGHRLGLRTCAMGEIVLDGVELGRGAVLDGAEDFVTAFHRLLSRRRLWNAARALGLARAATEYAAGYAQEREAFGHKIGQFQSIAFMIADDATLLDSARWLVWRAAWMLDQGQDATREAALAALQAHEAAVKATIDNIQVMGGQGFMKDYPCEKWMRDARALFNLAGGTEILNLAASGAQGLPTAG